MIGALDHRDAFARDAGERQLFHETLHTAESAVVVMGDTGKHCETSMAEVQQKAGTHPSGLFVVEADGRSRSNRIRRIGEDIRNALLLQQRNRLGVMTRPDKHDGSRSAFEQKSCLFEFEIDVIGRRADDKTRVFFSEPGLKSIHHGRVDGVAEGRDHHACKPRLTGAG